MCCLKTYLLNLVLESNIPVSRNNQHARRNGSKQERNREGLSCRRERRMEGLGGGAFMVGGGSGIFRNEKEERTIPGVLERETEERSILEGDK